MLVVNHRYITLGLHPSGAVGTCGFLLHAALLGECIIIYLQQVWVITMYTILAEH